MASGSTGHGLDLVRARLMELFPPNARTGPDEPAIKKLEDLCRRKRSAAVCVLDELAINLGVNGPAQGAEAIRADGEEWRMEPNGVAQPPFQPSSALVGIVKRWNLHLDGRRPCPGRDVAGSKRMAADARYDRRPPPAQRNQELHNSFAQQPVQQPRQPPQPPLEPQPVLRCPDETADDAVAVIQKAKFDLRFRLYAAGALERFRGRPDELKELINEIETAGENADAKNAVCARRGLSLGFFMPAAHCTVIYQVIVTKDGDVRYDLPTETGSAIAHRRLGSHLLRVRFERLASNALHEDQERWEKMRHLILSVGADQSGIRSVAGDRLYLHFCHKDADKPEAQLWFVSVPATHRELKKQAVWVHQMQQLLLDTQGTTDGRTSSLSISKLNARLCLAFSTAVTVPVCAPTEEAVLDLRDDSGRSRWQELAALEPMPAGKVKLVIINDIRVTAADGSQGSVMTDGAGLISRNLAEQMPLCLSGRLVSRRALGAPLLAQVRVWHRGYVVKGMLMTDSTLPDGYVIVRESMVKVFARPGGAATLCADKVPKRLPRGDKNWERSAFEVLRTSNGAPSGKMNPQLVPLLEHSGGPRGSEGRTTMVGLLLSLAEENKRRICQIDSEELSGPQLRSLLLDFGLGETSVASYMLLAGFHPRKEPYLRRKIAAVQKAQLEQIASGKFKLPGSLYLTGVPDPTGTVPAGKVVVVEGGKFCVEQLLIYRCPGTHPGDVRRTESAMPPGPLLACLEHVAAELQNAIIFSVQGERALADMLSGGDYDGDEFVVMRASDKIDTGVAGMAPLSLVDAFQNESPPWVQQPKEGGGHGPPSLQVTDDHQQTCAGLARHYFDCDAAGGLIGQAANSIQMAQEYWGCAHWITLELIDLYNTALDAAKQGVRKAFPETIREQLNHMEQTIGLPCFMVVKASEHRRVQPDGSSNSAMGRLWCKRRQLRLSSEEDTPGGGCDADLDFGLVKCHICGLECGAEELRMHVRCCCQLHELRYPGQPLPSEPLPSEPRGREWGPVRIRFYDKWRALIALAIGELSSLWQRSLGRTTSAGARQKYDAAFAHAKLALFDRYRQHLLESYDEGERERPAHVLLCEASHVYLAAYGFHGNEQACQQARELAWQIAGSYLVLIKFMREQHGVHPGMAPRGLVAAAQLPRILARRGNLPHDLDGELAAEGLAVVEASDGGGVEDGEELVSTPWSRCA